MAHGTKAWKDRAAALRLRAGRSSGAKQREHAGGNGAVTVVNGRRGLFDSARNAAERARSVLRLQVELAALEMKRKSTAIGIGVGFGLAAGFVAVFGLLFVFLTIAAALATFLSLWLSLLIVTLVIFLAAGALGFLALRSFKKASSPVPKAALREAKLTSEALKR